MSDVAILSSLTPDASQTWHFDTHNGGLKYFKGIATELKPHVLQSERSRKWGGLGLDKQEPQTFQRGCYGIKAGQFQKLEIKLGLFNAAQHEQQRKNTHRTPKFYSENYAKKKKKNTRKVRKIQRGRMRRASSHAEMMTGYLSFVEETFKDRPVIFQESAE